MQDHVERHLAEELRLDDLARVACFSPFHFHRIYVALTGETVREFVQRVRLERAASQLLRDPTRSVTAVALDLGFGSPAAFARAFRAAFGTSASAFRKNRKADRKPGKAGARADGHAGGVAPGAPDGPAPAGGGWEPHMQTHAQPMKEAEAVEIKDLPATTVAYVRHVGPYAGNPGLFEGLFAQLFQWAGPRGLVGPAARVLTVYHDDPNVTAPEKLRVSACVTVPPGTRGEREVGVLELPAGRCAVARFALQPPEYQAAWNWVMGAWLPSSGWEPDDRPCYEVMLNDPCQDPAGVHRVEIVVPVKPL